MTLDDLIDAQEMVALEQTYGPFPRQHCRLAVRGSHLEYWGQKVLRDRRGEVVLVIQRDSGEVLLHTKTLYPPGVYRLPSGGVSWGETVSASLRREVYEETGFTAWEERFLGLVSYDFRGADRSVSFVSYVFLLTGVQGSPDVKDEDERISGFKWVSVSELPAVAAALRSLPEDSPGRQDWGRFRALAHDFAAERL